MHQSCDASLHHQAWHKFFSTRKGPDESYSEFATRMEGLWAKIDRLTPSGQSMEKRGAELTLFGILFALHFDDHVCQSLTTQPNLTLEQAMGAFDRIDTGMKHHLAGTDSANVARNASCWTCNLPGHLSYECPPIMTKDNRPLQALRYKPTLLRTIMPVWCRD